MNSTSPSTAVAWLVDGLDSAEARSRNEDILLGGLSCGSREEDAEEAMSISTDPNERLSCLICAADLVAIVLRYREQDQRPRKTWKSCPVCPLDIL